MLPRKTIEDSVHRFLGGRCAHRGEGLSPRQSKFLLDLIDEGIDWKNRMTPFDDFDEPEPEPDGMTDDDYNRVHDEWLDRAIAWADAFPLMDEIPNIAQSEYFLVMFILMLPEEATMGDFGEFLCELRKNILEKD